MRNNYIKAKVGLALLAAFSVAIGFNTIDIMLWSFYYQPWREWFPYQWQMNTYLSMEVWDAYVVFGILPLTIGCVLLGSLLTDFYHNGARA